MLVKTIGTVYGCIQLSLKRLQHFKDMAALLESDTVKFQHHCNICWLSMGGCLTALIRNYEPLMVVLWTEADYGDPTAHGLFKHLSSYKSCALLHFMADILSVTNHLSRILQHRDVCFSTAKKSVSLFALTS